MFDWLIALSCNLLFPAPKKIMLMTLLHDKETDDAGNR